MKGFFSFHLSIYNLNQRSTAAYILDVHWFVTSKTFLQEQSYHRASLFTKTVFSQLWLTRVFLTSPCHRLQLQLIPNLFRTTVPYLGLHHTHTHTDSVSLGVHTHHHHPRNTQTTGNASDLHHNDLKRCNVLGVKSPAGKASRSCVNVSDQSP